MDFSRLVVAPNIGVFGKPLTITPAVGSPYSAQGIWTVRHVDLALDDGEMMTSRTLTMDVRLTDLPVLPAQGDVVTLVADDQSLFDGSAIGDNVNFVIDDVNLDGGGAAKLILKRVI